MERRIIKNTPNSPKNIKDLRESQTDEKKKYINEVKKKGEEEEGVKRHKSGRFRGSQAPRPKSDCGAPPGRRVSCLREPRRRAIIIMALTYDHGINF